MVAPMVSAVIAAAAAETDRDDQPQTSAAQTRGEAAVQDQFDVTLEDADLLTEVELTTNLIIAASETDDHLGVEEIDAILGIESATG